MKLIKTVVIVKSSRPNPAYLESIKPIKRPKKKQRVGQAEPEPEPSILLTNTQIPKEIIEELSVPTIKAYIWEK
jgi:hypothetical protein